FRPRDRPAGAGPRRPGSGGLAAVIFERLEIRGFRSYAEPIEVRFDGGLNVFMGRNEAGKTGLLRAIQCALFPPSRGTDRHSLLAYRQGACPRPLERL